MQKCKPFRWLLGLIPFVLVAYLIVISIRSDIESELVDKARLALGDAGLNWAEVTFEGRDAVVSGETGRKAERLKALKVVSKIHGVRVVKDQANLYARVSPFIWAVRKAAQEKKQKELKLDGYVSSEKDRREIIGLLRASFPEFEIRDRMVLASGAPNRDILFSGISFGIQQLDHLDFGMIRMEDHKLSISGTTIQSKSYLAVTAALKAELPSGFVLDKVNIRPPLAAPFSWQASYDGSNLRLKGHVPSESVRRNHIKLLRQLLPKANIVDETELASGAVKGFGKASNLALAQLSRMEKGSVSIHKDSVIFDGEVNSPNLAGEISKAVKLGLPKTIKFREKLMVSGNIPEIAKNQPSSFWVADRSQNLVTLSGFVPNQSSRKEVLEITRLIAPGTRIVDGMKLSSGNPSGQNWIKAVRFCLWQLGKLKNGSVKLKKDSLFVSGEASDLSNFHALQVALAGGLPSNVMLKENAVLPPQISSYRWEATLQNGRLVFAGFVPSEDHRRQIIEFAILQYPDAKIVDKMNLASGAPKDWILVVTFGIEQLKGLKSGSVQLLGREFLISGVTDRKELADDRKKKLRNELPEGFTGSGKFEVKTASPELLESTASLKKLPDSGKRPQARNEDKEIALKKVPKEERVGPDVCQVLMDSALNNGTIRFRSASAVIETESEPLLKHLAYIARRCPTSEIEISGHTDSVGGDELNKSLSEERAKSVVEFLVDDGIARSRLKAAGYGESRPLVPNSSEENKARNRRIEFRIIR